MRRIKDAKITLISLCARGKNRLPVLYKADGNSVTFEPLVKAPADFDERGELLAVVYAPEQRDADGDVADANTIRKMAHSYARDGRGLDIHHDGKPLAKSAAYVAESFIIQKGDERFAGWKNDAGAEVDVTGGWGILVQIEDPALRKAYREGAWNGVSMFGQAVVETGKSDLATQLVDTFKALLAQGDQRTHEEDDMKPEELSAALAKNNEELAKSLTTSIATAVAAEVAKALKPPEQKPEDKKGDTKPDAEAAPVFKGDRTNLEDVRKHRDAVKAYELRKGVDWSKPESIEKYEAELEKLAKAKGDGKGDGKGGDTTEPAGSNADGQDTSPLAKADTKEAVTLGKSMAKYAMGTPSAKS